MNVSKERVLIFKRRIVDEVPRRDGAVTSLIYGYEAVVRLLLDTGEVDADSRDKDGLTPLWWATESGCEAVVKRLLDAGKVDADSKDKGSQTPLSRAARGHEAVVKL